MKDYSKELASTLAEADESFVNDVIGLCLCVVSIDGKFLSAKKITSKNSIKRKPFAKIPTKGVTKGANAD